MQRLAGQFDDALTTYRHIQHAFPESRECRLSYLVAGRLLLDHARPDLAAVEFDSYLETRGAASEEALVGHATALRRMGRWSEEASDWQKLLSEHPTSVYATRARARLGALEASHTPPMDGAGKAFRLSP
jgi:outer membrane protein assembly factor BamD (BamD/ComL family)